MSTLTPPVTLEDSKNQSKVDYVLDVSSSPDFDYPPVSWLKNLLFFSHNCTVVNWNLIFTRVEYYIYNVKIYIYIYKKK